MGFVRLSLQTEIMPLYAINQLSFPMVKSGVLSEVRTEFLNVILKSLRLSWLTNVLPLLQPNLLVKDERVMPGDLNSRKFCSAPPAKCSVSHYPPHFLSLSSASNG
jgi:hypothetical protein